jgi:hypothetical protein
VALALIPKVMLVGMPLPLVLMVEAAAVVRPLLGRTRPETAATVGMAPLILTRVHPLLALVVEGADVTLAVQAEQVVLGVVEQVPQAV